MGGPARELLGHRPGDDLTFRRGVLAVEQWPSPGFHAGRCLPRRLPVLSMVRSVRLVSVVTTSQVGSNLIYLTAPGKMFMLNGNDQSEWALYRDEKP